MLVQMQRCAHSYISQWEANHISAVRRWMQKYSRDVGGKPEKWNEQISLANNTVLFHFFFNFVVHWSQ